jgi:hypothetical protein
VHHRRGDRDEVPDARLARRRDRPRRVRHRLRAALLDGHGPVRLEVTAVRDEHDHLGARERDVRLGLGHRVEPAHRTRAVRGQPPGERRRDRTDADDDHPARHRVPAARTTAP